MSFASVTLWCGKLTDGATAWRIWLVSVVPCRASSALEYTSTGTASSSAAVCRARARRHAGDGVLARRRRVGAQQRSVDRDFGVRQGRARLVGDAAADRGALRREGGGREKEQDGRHRGSEPAHAASFIHMQGIGKRRWRLRYGGLREPSSLTERPLRPSFAPTFQPSTVSRRCACADSGTAASCSRRLAAFFRPFSGPRKRRVSRTCARPCRRAGPSPAVSAPATSTGSTAGGAIPL